MALFDILVCAVIIMAAVKGFQTGFIVEVFSLFAFFVGLFLALKLTFPVSEEYFGESDAFWLIALVLFLVSMFAVIWIAKFFATSVKKVIDFTPVGILDNLLGACFSVIKWLFLFSTLIWVMNSVEIGFPRKWTEDARLFEVVTRFAPVLVDFVSYYIPWFRDILDTMNEVRIRF